MMLRNEATQQLVNLLNVHPNNTRFSDLELQTIANLLQQNADVTVQNHLGTTLFHLLVYYNFDGKFSDFISYLVLAKNVDVDIVNAQGYTALQKLLEGDFVIDCAPFCRIIGNIY